MPKYTHYITIPFTSALNLAVESDKPCTNRDEAYDLAMQELDDLCVKVEVTGTGERDGEPVELSENVEFHKSLVSGNVVHASVPDINWETEED